MKTSITKRLNFSAAHSLPHHEGKCRFVHGHNFGIKITVSGPLHNGGGSEGMVMDFVDLKKIVSAQIEVFDHGAHGILNDFFNNPTAEIIAGHLFELIRFELPGSVKLESVEVSETEDSWVTVTA